MKEIVVISGKGGTGKTSLVGSLAVLARHKVLVDCDVDAADLHLLLAPRILETQEFRSGLTAVIDKTKCTRCGLCQTICRFSAIKDFKVESFSCEGCGFCEQICPVKAITLRENLAGEWYISQTRFGTLVHARLGIAQENSGKLVATVRRKAREIAQNTHLDYIISDGPPGIGCPVISSISGADLAVLVTEPTLSGIHDLKRILEVCRHFDLPALVCINKYDINLENTAGIERFCAAEKVDVAAKIPFDNVVTEAMVKGIPVVEHSQGIISREIEKLWQIIRNELVVESPRS